MNQENNNKDTLKLINMRTVHDLVSVECIAELYNRYESRINQIRFKNVDAFWVKGVVRSYAPTSEWEEIRGHISNRFLAFDFLLIKNLISLYLRKRNDSEYFLKKFRKDDIETYSDFELINSLETFQSLVFCDLYRLNFVQIEHGLSSAIELFLDKNYGQEIAIEIKKTVSDFLFLTASGAENNSLKKKACFIKATKLFSFSFLTNYIYSHLLEKHYRRFSHLYCAYGELPKTKDFFEKRINEELSKKISFLQFSKLFGVINVVYNFINNSSCSLKILFHTKSIRLLILVLLQFFGGKFRDTNKALLGISTQVRFLILDEIARRGFESRENLRFYAFEEIYTLVLNSEKLDHQLLHTRKVNGVHIKKTSSLDILESSLDIMSSIKTNNSESISGTCASRGFARGRCKVILSKEDITKIEEGDIMVAIGTDFDLIEGMYKSSAIITEEGGLLSHAAVVCRELKKPCVIGIRNATSVFVDNVIVEVFADEGRVELIQDF